MYRSMFDGNLSDSIKYLAIFAALSCLMITILAAAMIIIYKIASVYLWDAIRLSFHILRGILEGVGITIKY